MLDHPLVRQMLAGMRVMFWIGATILGSGGIIFMAASFNKPEFAGRAIGSLLAAIGLLCARDATPK